MEINIDDLVLENEIELGTVELDIKTEVPDIENITITPTSEEQVFTHPNSYGYDEVTVEAIPEEYIIPEGTLEITENGEYNIKNYENANVNVSSETSFIIENCNNLFSNNRRIENLNDLIPLCKPTTCYYMFFNSNQLINVPVFDASEATTCESMFSGCSALISIPILNFNSNKENYAMFGNCLSLSDESLNNIMASVIGSNIKSKNSKTLKYMGLSSSQATRCQSLSNYQAFLNAGWTTGY